ncbi:hypothetical protein BCA37_17290 [Mycobacterium sp. djl-10]|nr:hypothetical protein BCA37_17290 [Mycobacterium sp. djl-10]
MRLPTDEGIFNAVQTVYTTDLALPDEWDCDRRMGFLEAEAEKIAWMVRAEADTISDQDIEKWIGQHGCYPDSSTQRTIRLAARAEAMQSVLNTELYELIAVDIDD